MKLYGSKEPPHYDVTQIKGFKIMLCFGITDRLITIEDAEYLRDIFVGSDNDVTYREYDVGHIGIMMPKDLSITQEMLDKIISVNKHVK